MPLPSTLLHGTQLLLDCQTSLQSSDQVLRSIFYDTVRDRSEISADIGVYDRTKKGDPDYERVHSYQFLWNAVRDYLDRELRKKQKAQLDKAYSGEPTKVTPVLGERKPKALRKIEAAQKKKEAALAAQKGSPPTPVAPLLTKSNLACFDFRNSGNCKFGDSCKSEVGGLRPTGKSFRFVRACARSCM